MPIDRHSRAYKAKRDAVKRRWAADQRRCYLEGCELDYTPQGQGQDNGVELDHIIPVAKGGSVMNVDNWAPACRKHNREKSDLTLDEYRAKRAGKQQQGQQQGQRPSTTRRTTYWGDMEPPSRSSIPPMKWW